ncbi:tetratricopeptide repeat protein [Flavobacterium rhizosphaerae]|uniref:Tetratricopeptide repeat protein n=1 Tax=Flavobacterium rhizosphaerae TaxID=3163298 RepID=A0ABW8YU72_9FLAO
MTTKDYTYLLNKPYSLTEKQTIELENILNEFPYLQSARAIYLKGLYNRDSFRYNSELKKTATYTTERQVLFDFITSEHFRSIQKDFLTEEENTITGITVKDSEHIKESQAQKVPEQIADKKELSVKRSIKEAAGTSEDTTEHDITQKEAKPAGTGKPLQFDGNEKHSFAEWLQLSKIKPINRNNTQDEQTAPLKAKLELIDKFIDNNPKIAPVKNSPSPTANVLPQSGDAPALMTETLARVYLEQKKYTKAIQAYEILILKYPEKSAFFAHRISEIKDLQQNNN